MKILIMVSPQSYWNLLSCLVDIPGRPAVFLKENGGRMDLGDKGCGRLGVVEERKAEVEMLCLTKE